MLFAILSGNPRSSSSFLVVLAGVALDLRRQPVDTIRGWGVALALSTKKKEVAILSASDPY